MWQEVCDQAALSGVWHSGLHDTGQDCKAATSAGLDHSPGTCKEGMPCMKEFTQGITCYAGCLIFNIVFSSDHLCSISAVSTVDSEMKSLLIHRNIHASLIEVWRRSGYIYLQASHVTTECSFLTSAFWVLPLKLFCIFFKFKMMCMMKIEACLLVV